MNKQKNILQVMVAERSSFSRLVLEDILGSASDIQVCGLAADGEQLLQQLQAQKVDVVVASADLRQKDSLLVFKRIFSECPTPIVMLAERELLTLDVLREAIELGVYGVVMKPSPNRRPNYRSIASEIQDKVRAVRESEYWNPEKRLRLLEQEVKVVRPAVRKPKVATAEIIIVIGASTGGTQAVETIVKQLDPALKAAVLVAVHLPQKFTQSFTRRLKSLTPWQVVEGRAGLIPKPGMVIIAPGGQNMVVKPVMGNMASLKIGFAEEGLASGFDMPSVDLLMQSVADSGVNQVIGVILTGMGRDGTEGAAAILNRSGGHVIAQDEQTSAIFGMAKSAIESGNIHKVLPLSQIAFYLNKYVAEQQQVSATDNHT